MLLLLHAGQDQGVSLWVHLLKQGPPVASTVLHAPQDSSTGMYTDPCYISPALDSMLQHEGCDSEVGLPCQLHAGTAV
jgi:hypothetical protein